ncbi:MAG: GNAT family N-acetyltransferase [Deltaproteobacteria bacterium]|nr:GNAT family N-acetyltransferase [Deltaproteobacteria bacterium]
MIRTMNAEDVAEVLEVRTSTIENAMTMEALEAYGITEDSVIEGMKSHTRGWVCEINARIVGFSMASRTNGEVLVLAILPSVEGRGIGARLLGEARDWLFSVGYDEIWLKTTPDPSLRAYGFYLHQGWKPSGTIEDEDEVFVLAARDQP